MRYVLIALALTVFAFGAGVSLGWESGRRDANQFNSEVCHVR